MVKTLEKPQARKEDKSEVRFRCKHRDDKAKSTRSMAKFSEGHKCEDGSTFTIQFTTVPHEIHPVIPAYSEYIFSRSATFPENLTDKKWAGKLIYDYIQQHPDFLSGTIFEDKKYATKLDFGELDMNDLKVAKEANVQRILLEDEMRAKEERIKELDNKGDK